MTEAIAIPLPSPTTDPLDEAGGRALVVAWQASALSGAAYCRQHGMRPQRLHYWRERLGYPIKVVAVARRTTVSSSVASGFVEMVVGAPPTTDVDIVVGGACIPIQP